jgi:hypothetical protein
MRLKYIDVSLELQHEPLSITENLNPNRASKDGAKTAPRWVKAWAAKASQPVVLPLKLVIYFP